MPTFLLSLLAKIGPYVAAAAMAFGAGLYVAHRWDLGTIASARLAVSQQQLADAQATAHWNGIAAAFQVKIAGLQNEAQVNRAAQRASAAADAAQQDAQIGNTAQVSGQDMATAPVLLGLRANLAREMTP